ncbi:Zinc finger, C2H2 [Kalmanozyma brasiliensis GHG001]|uniref:C2H2-type domain-containing protein n=1 Tax=Kalmanozyma brasiliensis (strain GHG001) TaxID=1365824 RepID=V5EE33_KALBG|nr:Zinc finger, C2H2 [Kalmanozyma brasiliensis GHG001]EST08736.1 Zinc finger, C2H2 [Kalmanozyma brasiliensis GHG001]
MAVAQRHDGVGQYGFGQHYTTMTPPSSFNNFGYDRRPKTEDPAEPLWPVPRVQQQPPQQGPASERSSITGSLPSDFGRGPPHQSNYTYDGASSAMRNPVVYSQPAPVGWGLGGPSSAHYAEYPTASYMAPLGQRALPPMQGSTYLGATNGAPYGDSSLYPDAYPKVMGGPAPMGGPYDHNAETMWPLGPNSLDAFAGMPAPSGQIARLTLTSAADKGKLKARTTLPPPKQFKCSACDAIFSRNHDLKRHARIHLAVKPFPCGYCDKAFSRKDALKRHVLVKGCGIGNKKSGDNRKRAATLSKLEGSDGPSASRPPYDGVPSDTRGFREYNQPGAQTSWPSTLTDATVGGGGDYTSPRMDERGQMQLNQGYSQNYGFMSGEGFPQQQRQQLAGGLVNAFTSPAGTSASSPTESQPRYAVSGVGEEAKSSLAAANFAPAPPSVGGLGLAVAGIANDQPAFGVDNEGKRFGGNFAQQPPMLSPPIADDPTVLKRHHQQSQQQQQQQPFGGFLGNNAH